MDLKGFGIETEAPRVNDYRYFSKDVHRERYNLLNWSSVTGSPEKDNDGEASVGSKSFNSDLMRQYPEETSPNCRNLARLHCQPKFPRRHNTERQNNVFEALAAGIGAAAEEEEAEKLKEHKKKQFRALIEERKAAIQAKKKAEIEKEQMKSTQADLQKSQAVVALKRAEEEELSKSIQSAIENEVASLTTKYSNIAKSCNDED